MHLSTWGSKWLVIRKMVSLFLDVAKLVFGDEGYWLIVTCYVDCGRVRSGALTDSPNYLENDFF